MAKAILAAPRSDGSWYVAQIYADGTNMQGISNPPSGQLLLKWRPGSEPSLGDDLTAETICAGLATVIASAATINWTSVKQAIN
jgi:hypothetical protein